MDNLNKLTEQMLRSKNIISLQQIQEVHEVNEHILPPVIYIKYENGEEQYIKGDTEINNFINRIIANR